MAVPMTRGRSGALIAPALQHRLQFGFQHLLDEGTDLLAHPGFQRIEPVFAKQWHGGVQACILLHGVVSYGGDQTAG